MANLMNTPNSRTVARRPNGFGDVFGWDPFRDVVSNFNRSYGIEVTKTEGGYQVELPVAGFKPEQINVTLEDNVLSVSGQNDKRSFSRSLLVPDEIDRENINAKVEDGMLTLSLHLHPKMQPKKITVEVVK